MARKRGRWHSRTRRAVLQPPGRERAASGARGGVCERRAGGGGGSGGPSLKNKLWSGNKLGAMHAEESKKIQAQLKELHYGKKDLIFKAQQLTDLEQKLSVAKDKLENAALDKESQLKALKETVQLCLCSVLRSQPPAASLMSSKPAEKLLPPMQRAPKPHPKAQAPRVYVAGMAHYLRVQLGIAGRELKSLRGGILMVGWA
nr:leucine zipper protein 2 [Taeniopygia guttata]